MGIDSLNAGYITYMIYADHVHSENSLAFCSDTEYKGKQSMQLGGIQHHTTLSHSHPRLFSPLTSKIVWR